MIQMEIDAPLSPADATTLRSHLRSCSSCRAYQLALSTTLAALREDAEAIAGQADPSPAYFDALRGRLLEADADMGKRPIAAIDRPVLRVLQAISPVPVPVRRALATAALFLAMTLACATQVLRPAEPPYVECRLGHMPSLRVQVSPTGRAYASLASQTALPRRACEEALQ